MQMCVGNSPCWSMGSLEEGRDVDHVGHRKCSRPTRKESVGSTSVTQEGEEPRNSCNQIKDSQPATVA